MAETSIKRIGRYEIQEELGRGGYGRVYRAYDPTVGRMVAIKILTAEGKDLLTRFRNEAAAAGNLNHRNIVTIYDFGDYEGVPYIAMEFLAGDDLSHLIANHAPLTLLQKVSVMLQVADGLYCAHRNGVVHRDVKPANIRLLPDGNVKIMDFGIARVTRDNATPRLTLQGDLIGTLLYMSPEQVMGGDVDALSDIFAYGVTYYELLTGKHPFHASDPGAVLYKITSQDPQSIRSLAPDCPEALEQVIRRALHRERELRYQDLRDVVIDTEPVLLELRQERASNLLAEAKELFGGGELEKAQALAMEALDLDPANRETRELRAAIQQRLQRLLLQPRIDELVAKGQTAIEQRRLSEAVESFESAARLDPTNDTLKARAVQARELLDKNRAAMRLLAEARRSYARQDLEASAKSAADALQTDPGNADAERFLAQVRSAQERQRRFEDGLANARALLEQERFDDATGAVAALDPEQQESPAAKELLAAIGERRALYERRQAVAFAERDAQALLKENEFGRARSVLHGVARTFPGEQALERLLGEVDRAEADWLRRCAIDEATASAETMRANGQFEGALKALEKVRREYGDDPGVAALAGQIGAERQARLEQKQKVEAIERAEREADALVAQNKFAQAREAVDRPMRQYPEEVRLQELRRKVEAGEAAWMRGRALEEAASRAEALRGSAQFDAALGVIESARQKHGDNTELASLAKTIVVDREAFRRAEAIGGELAKAEALSKAGEFQQAIDVLEAALKQYAGEAELQQAVARARQALAERKKAEAIAAAEREANALSKSGDIARAIDVVRAAQAAYPSEARLKELIRQFVEQLELAIDESVQQAAALTVAGQFDAALSLIGAATPKLGEDKRLSALAAKIGAERERVLAAQQKAREIQDALREAKVFADRNEFASARKVLAGCQRKYPDEPQLGQLQSEVEAGEADWQRRKAIGEAATQAEQLRGKGQFDEALKIVEQARQKHGDDPALSDLAGKIVAGREAAERAEAIRKATTKAQSLMKAGTPAEAVRVLEAALKKYENDSTLSHALGQAKDAQAQKLKADAISKAERETKALLDKSDFEAAREVVAACRAAYGSDERIERLNLQVETLRRRAIEDAANRADGLREQRDFDGALRVVAEAKKKHGDDRTLVVLAEQIATEHEACRRAEAVHSAIIKAEALVAGGEEQEAVRLLEGAAKECTGEPLLEQALRSSRDALAAKLRTQAINKAEQEVKALIEASDFARARQVQTAAQRAYAGDARLAQLQRSLDDAEAVWNRRRAIDEVVSRADSLRAQKQFDKALKTIETCQRKHGDDPALSELAQKIRTEVEDRRKSQAVGEAVSKSESFIKAGQAHEAIRVLETASAAYPNEQALSESLARARQALAQKQKADAILRAEREAKAFLDRSDFRRAREVVTACLATYPGEARIQQLQRTIDAAEAAWMRRRVVDEAVSRAEALRAKQQFDDALQVIDIVRRKQGDDPALAALAERTAKERAAFLQAQAEQAKRAAAVAAPVHTPPRPAPAPITATKSGLLSGRRAIAAGAIAAAAVLAAILIVPRLTRETAPATLPFEIRTRPPGAVISFGSSSCTTPQCQVQLQPGEHTFQARLTGYRDQTAKRVVGGGSGSLDLTLEPLPSTLQLTTNFSEGSVNLDGRTAGQLRDGQLVLDSITPGQHRLEVTSKDGTLSVGFDAATARKPSIGAPPQVQRMDAVLVTSFNGEVTVTCPSCTGEALLDGVSKGRFSDGRLTLTGIPEGARELEVREGSNSRKLVFRTGNSPLISAHLTSTQDRGILLVETAGQEEATVFINGRRWARGTTRGQLTLTLDAEDYVIRVEKPGYRANPPEIRASVKKGEQVRAPFRLDAVEATLTIAGQPAGAVVTLDGRRVGAVNSDGVFSTNVQPGVRQIELSKEGYQPVTISRSFGPGAAVRVDASEAQLQAIPKPPEPKPVESPKPVQTAPPPPRPDPAAVEAQQWERVRDTRDVRELTDFVSTYPGGRFARQAESKIEELEWSSTDKNNKGALEAFIRKHPGGAFAEQASKAIAGIEDAERKRGEVAAVLATVNRYQEAYKREDAESVRALYVNMPGRQFDEIRRSFRDFQVVSLQLTPDAPQVFGDTAVVRCARTLVVKDSRGEYPVSDVAIFTLARQGGEWRIASLASQKR